MTFGFLGVEVKLLPAAGLCLVALVAIGGGQSYLKKQEQQRVAQQAEAARQAEIAAAEKKKKAAAAAAEAEEARRKQLVAEEYERRRKVLGDLQAISNLHSEFMAAYVVASNTPRVSLAGQVARLQDIRKRADQLEAMQCAVDVLAPSRLAMDYYIAGLVHFMGEESYQSAYKIGMARDSAGKYLSELSLCSRSMSAKPEVL